MMNSQDEFTNNVADKSPTMSIGSTPSRKFTYMINIESSPWDSLLQRIADETVTETPMFIDEETPRKSKSRDYGYTPGKIDTIEIKINGLGEEFSGMELAKYNNHSPNEDTPISIRKVKRGIEIMPPFPQQPVPSKRFSTIRKSVRFEEDEQFEELSPKKWLQKKRLSLKEPIAEASEFGHRRQSSQKIAFSSKKQEVFNPTTQHDLRSRNDSIFLMDHFDQQIIDQEDNIENSRDRISDIVAMPLGTPSKALHENPLYVDNFPNQKIKMTPKKIIISNQKRRLSRFQTQEDSNQKDEVSFLETLKFNISIKDFFHIIEIEYKSDSTNLSLADNAHSLCDFVESNKYSKNIKDQYEYLICSSVEEIKLSSFIKTLSNLLLVSSEKANNLKKEFELKNPSIFEYVQEAKGEDFLILRSQLQNCYQSCKQAARLIYKRERLNSENVFVNALKEFSKFGIANLEILNEWIAYISQIENDQKQQEERIRQEKNETAKLEKDIRSLQKHLDDLEIKEKKLEEKHRDFNQKQEILKNLQNQKCKLLEEYDLVSSSNAEDVTVRKLLDETLAIQFDIDILQKFSGIELLKVESFSKFIKTKIEVQKLFSADIKILKKDYRNGREINEVNVRLNDKTLKEFSEKQSALIAEIASHFTKPMQFSYITSPSYIFAFVIRQLHEAYYFIQEVYSLHLVNWPFIKALFNSPYLDISFFHEPSIGTITLKLPTNIIEIFDMAYLLSKTDVIGTTEEIKNDIREIINKPRDGKFALKGAVEDVCQFLIRINKNQ